MGETLGTANPGGEQARYNPPAEEMIQTLTRACRSALAKLRDHEPGSVTVELLESVVSSAQQYKAEPSFTLEEIDNLSLHMRKLSARILEVGHEAGGEASETLGRIAIDVADAALRLQKSRR